MVKLPSEFVATKYPGYFWNTETQVLYSLKIDGVLKPLKIINPNRWNSWPMPGYRVSVKGRGRYLPIGYLKGLKPKPFHIASGHAAAIETIPVRETKKRGQDWRSHI